MDVSADYIKMCESAEEVQKKWVPNIGDWCLDSENEIKVLGNVVNYYAPSKSAAGPGCGGCSLGYKLKTWLPRQDQLLEMMDGQGNLPLVLQGLCKKADSWGGKEYKSFEQLWLGFVMQEKYHKTWNGENWVLP